MLRLLMGLVGVELRHTVRRASTTALLFFLAALLLGAAIIAFLVAGYILLAERYDPVMAAFIIAGLCLIGSLIFFLIAYMRTRRRAPAPVYGGLSGLMGGAPVATPVASVPPPGVVGSPPPPPMQASTVVAVAAGAALLGLILGRRI